MKRDILYIELNTSQAGWPFFERRDDCIFMFIFIINWQCFMCPSMSPVILILFYYCKFTFQFQLLFIIRRVIIIILKGIILKNKL